MTNSNRDANDVMLAGGVDEVSVRLGEILKQADSGGGVEEAGTARRPPSRAELAITSSEMGKARLSPPCIVKNHLYADVAQRVAPGGTGKTTLALYEHIHIALGVDLYGCRVESPGWVLVVTAEDRREYLVARLARIMESMELTDEQAATVMCAVCLWDVTGLQAKLVQEFQGSILLTSLPDELTEAYRDDPPVLVEIDPAVSFGAGEQRVNDNEQGLIDAARRIVRGLNCCVRYTHHTGKASAREKSVDQYTGRGGSALADGTRITSVLQAWSEEDRGNHSPPPTLQRTRDSSVMIYARPKVSYAPPNLPHIWIARDGFSFTWALEHHQSAGEQRKQLADQLLRFVVSELGQNRLHNKTTLRDQHDKLGMTWKQITEAVSELTVSGRLVEHDLPAERRQGSRKHYLGPPVQDEK